MSMLRSTLTFTVACALSLPMSASGQSLTKIDAAAFDRGDRDAQEMLSVVRCAQRAALERMEGAFGPVDSLGRAHQCVRIQKRWAVVFAEIDTSFRSAGNVRAFDLGSRARVSVAFDTAGVVALERAELIAQRQGANEFRVNRRQYVPLSMRVDGDSIEVWLLPASLILGERRTLGGERGYLFGPDGRHVVRVIDSFADFRPIAVPDSGQVVIMSSQRSIPSFSEFLVANALHDLGRQVAISTAEMTSTLTTTPAGDIWIHTPKKE
jgi:hypothetical protein